MRHDTEIYKLIKERFGANKLHDERFSNKTYWEYFEDHNREYIISIKNQQGEYPTANPDVLSADDTPWISIGIPENIYIQWEGLKKSYPTLKGRQKQVLDLLLQGQLNQTLIGIQLKMKQSDVNKVLKVLAKKISKNIL